MQKLIVLNIVLWNVIFAGTTSWAQSISTNKVAEKTDWAVFIDKDPTECWVVAQPKQTVNKLNGRVVAAKRGEILLFVFYRPGEKLTGQVAFTGGYPFSKSAPLSFDIDGKKYFLPTIDDQWAWAASSADDSKIISAMKLGARAKITGKSNGNNRIILK